MLSPVYLTRVTDWMKGESDDLVSDIFCIAKILLPFYLPIGSINVQSGLCHFTRIGADPELNLNEINKQSKRVGLLAVASPTRMRLCSTLWVAASGRAWKQNSKNTNLN